jgi:hypothetical protein
MNRSDFCLKECAIMTWKRLALLGVLVFVTQGLVAGILFGLIGQRFDNPELFRPEGEEKVAPYMASRILFVGLFVYIFARWYPRRGRRAGLVYGLVMWLFYSVPMTVGFWSFLRLPGGLALAWVGIGLAEYASSGIVLGFVHDPNPDARAPRDGPPTS